MAGSDPGFDPAAFRSGILTAMGIADPGGVNSVTFRWTPKKTSTGAVDPGGIPYDLTSTATSTPKADVKVPAAVRYTPGVINDSPVGEFDVSKAVVTVLDTQYALVQGADIILIGTTPYRVDFIAPPLALFSVNIWEIYASAVTQGAHNVSRA